tara:strand:- start:1937 stop:2821 length:885 start_codon:yes stop_codon:yes gene_type:complete
MNYRRNRAQQILFNMGNVVTIMFHTLIDIVKIILWPIRKLLKEDNYLSPKSLLNDIRAIKGTDELQTNRIARLEHEIHDPLGGILNIQEEHSRYIQKSSKNQISCLEDNVDMVLDRLRTAEAKNKALEDNYVGINKVNDLQIGNKKAIKALEAKVNNQSELIHAVSELIDDDTVYWKVDDDVINKIKALEDENNASRIDSIENTLNKNIKLDIETDKLRGEQHDILLKAMKALEAKVTKLQLDTSDLTFLPADDDMVVRKEEYDYHQESKYWDRRAKEAYEDHMSEPKRREGDK